VLGRRRAVSTQAEEENSNAWYNPSGALGSKAEVCVVTVLLLSGQYNVRPPGKPAVRDDLTQWAKRVLETSDCPTADGYKPPASWRARNQWLHSFFKEMLADLSLARLHASIVVAKDMGVALSLDGLKRHAGRAVVKGHVSSTRLRDGAPFSSSRERGGARQSAKAPRLRYVAALLRPCRVVAE